MSIALNKSGFAIPAGLNYKGYTEVEPNKKDTDDNHQKKDEYQKKTHYYISNAKAFGAYLRKTWGTPDFTILPTGIPWDDHMKVIKIQEGLSPGEVAVFARKGHTGIFTKSYLDSFASWPSDPLDVWILKPK